jgi:hypothetical protein
MSATERNFIPLSDFVNDFCKSPEGLQLLNNFKKQKDEDPARFNLRFDYKLTSDRQSADINIMCAMDRFNALEELRSEWQNGSDKFCKSEFNDLFEEYHDYIIAAGDFVKAYRARKNMLQQEVIKQDKKRKV